ncbi:MAG: signal peptidase II [Pseudomonadota bacterium]
MRLLFLTALFTFALDQITKWAVVHALDLGNRLYMDVMPGFITFIMAWNEGINFGLFAGDGDITRFILIAMALGITGFVIYWMRREQNPWALASAGVLVGGALGNVVDRVIYGAVADFLNVTCCGIHNPFSFNVADITIFVGAIGLIFFATDHNKG